MEERRAKSCDRRRAALELARLMIVHGIGMRTRIRYAVNRIDEEYFDGEDLQNILVTALGQYLR